MSAGLDASTDTPGSTAPELSRTTPAIALCARAADANPRMSRMTARTRRTIIGPSCRRSLGADAARVKWRPARPGFGIRDLGFGIWDSLRRRHETVRLVLLFYVRAHAVASP